MDDWNKRHHNQSGLVERVKKSQYSLSDCESLTLDFIKPYTIEKAIFFVVTPTHKIDVFLYNIHA
jgi:oligoribonuclease (3'-5' exoribonuclease)